MSTAKDIPFVHLHLHTEFSLLDGACRIDKAVARANELGMKSLAITDHGVMYGVVDFYKKCKSSGIKPVLGCEAYLAHGSMLDKKTRDEDGVRSQSNHLVLLCQNNEGYQNLMYLISKAHLEGFYYKPRIDKQLLAQHAKGLIGSSACLKGDIAEQIVAGDIDAAVRLAGEYEEIFGKGNFYLEMMNHGIEDQRTCNQGMLEVHRRTGLPLIVSNDVHYLRQEHAEAHDVMLCLQTGTVMSNPDRMRYHSDQFFMKSGEQMLQLFADFPEALANTVAIAERCHVELRLDKDLHFPTYAVPEGYTQKEYLLKLGKDGLKRRYGIEHFDQPRNDEETKIIERFKFELSVIEKTGFINYFLVVWDFIYYAKSHGIPVGPGRGSGAGSIVAYALSITDIDPLRYNLIFERFLNPDRVSAPDFDIDFCPERRAEVIDYVKDKYGRDNVAQIITFNTLGAKAIIRDLARALEIPLNEADKLAKMIPDGPEVTLEKALKENPEFRAACENDPNAKRIMKHAPVLEGLSRNQGTHAAGVVIGEKPLIEILPLARDKNKEVITQFEMKPLGMVGLLKMDFLGLKTLTVLQRTVESVKKNHGVDVDVNNLPFDDTKTLDLLRRGDAVSVFQLESGGMRDLLRRLGPTCIEDLIALIALYRPGPMGMIDDFIARKHGKVSIEYDHPLLENILKETYGVMVYQEQVLQASNVLAGFSLGEGDVLRRAMGKKDLHEMATMREKFVIGCERVNKIPRKKAEKIFENIEKFAGYGFNKSHSAAYGVLAWSTAYLKAHYPVDFMAANLTVEIGNSDRLAELIIECQEMDIQIQPPSVNESGAEFTPIEGVIRFGLAGIKTVGSNAVDSLVAEREKNGAYRGLTDFFSRLDAGVVNKKVAEGLVRSGAFDFTRMPRSQLFAGIESTMKMAQSQRNDRRSGQGSLFDLGGGTSGPMMDELPTVDPWPASQDLAAEKELLGFYVSGHPLRAFASALTRYDTHSVKTFPELPNKTPARVGGLINGFVKRFTKKDQKPMGTFRLETLDGTIEAVCFTEAYQSYGVLLREDAPILACGEVSRKDDQPQFMVHEVYPLPDAHRYFAESLTVHLPAVAADDDRFKLLKQTLRMTPGETQVKLCLEYPGGEKVFINTDRTFKVAASEKLVHDIHHIVGEGSVYIAVNPNAMLRSHKRKFGERTEPVPTG